MATPPALDDLGFQPDPSDPQPIYLQLTAALAGAIRAGRIAVIVEQRAQSTPWLMHSPQSSRSSGR